MQYVKIYDTKRTEIDKEYLGDLINSPTWKNKSDWQQVPYGKTDWNFSIKKNNCMIQTDQYFMFFHSNKTEEPFCYGNIEGIPGQCSDTEMWIYISRGGSNGTCMNAEYSKIKIIKNTPDKVVIKVYFERTRGSATKGSVITYVFYNEFFKAIPGLQDTSHKLKYVYSEAHAAPNEFAVAPTRFPNVENDTIIDAEWNRVMHSLNSNDLYGIQSHRWFKDFNMVFTISDPRAEPFINAVAESAYAKIHSTGAYSNLTLGLWGLWYCFVSYKNTFVYNSILSVMTPHVVGGGGYSFKPFNVSKGSRYTLDLKKTDGKIWKEPFPAIWRLSVRINKKWYSYSIPNNDYNFTAYVSGKLDGWCIYLLDRTNYTPLIIKTPSDIYKTISGGIIIPPEPNPDGNFMNRLRQKTPDQVIKTSPYIDLGTYEDEEKIYRSLLYFDLSDVNKETEITSATLKLNWYYTEDDRNKTTTIDIFRPAIVWNNNYTTWNKYDQEINWKNPGGDWYDKNNLMQGNVSYGSCIIPVGIPNEKYYELDVTELIQKYINSEFVNTGFLLKARIETPNNYVAFRSFSADQNIPLLEINSEEPPVESKLTFKLSSNDILAYKIITETNNEIVFEINISQ